MQEKILVGHKLRRFRKTIGLSQTAMADALEISPSYLNLLEHNQRPLTVGLLLRLGNSFDIDLKDFAEDDAASLSTGVSEIFADPLLADEQVPRREIQDMITAAPGAARGATRLPTRPTSAWRSSSALPRARRSEGRTRSCAWRSISRETPA